MKSPKIKSIKYKEREKETTTRKSRSIQEKSLQDHLFGSKGQPLVWQPIVLEQLICPLEWQISQGPAICWWIDWKRMKPEQWIIQSAVFFVDQSLDLLQELYFLNLMGKKEEEKKEKSHILDFMVMVWRSKQLIQLTQLVQDLLLLVMLLIQLVLDIIESLLLLVQGLLHLIKLMPHDHDVEISKVEIPVLN